MASNKSSLREFQAHLAAKLAGASERSSSGLLGIQSGADFWLLNLSDSGEVVPLTTLFSVPLTRPWFLGVTNIRGNLYSVVDFSAFQGKEPTPQNASSRLLLIGARFGSNAALMVNRMLGLRNVDDLSPVVADPEAPAWAGQAYRDKDGRHWKMLNVRDLLTDEKFMDIAA